MQIDSHQHFWQYNATDYDWMGDEHAVIRKDFLPEDLAPLLAHSSIAGCVAVQARQSLPETDFLLDLAERHAIVKGVVGWVPLCDAKVEQHLESYASRKGIVGFRHVVHDESDDAFILRPDFNAGIKALGRYPLCYDILIFERHLPQTITFVDQHPDIRMVVDHIAKPVIRRDTFDQAWATNIKDLAQREHVTCKLSGMVTEVCDETWDTALLQPYFQTVLSAFGPDRLMFGSDWPVCLLRSEHAQWVDSVRELIAPLSDTEQAKIMGGTAQRVYGLIP
jgi:L-fuconolactonase